MSAVYIVLAIDKFSGIKNCEVYPGFKKASQRALELSVSLINETYIESDRESYYNLICEQPQEETVDNGIKWSFIDNFDIIVEVRFSNINKNDSDSDVKLISFNSWQSEETLYNESALPKSLDDPMQDDLPGGFSNNDSALTMKDLIENPYIVKPINKLTEDQKWALIIARIRHRPHYIHSVSVYGLGWQNQQSALQHLEDRDNQGLMLRDIELELLDEIRIQELNKQKQYEDD